MFGTRKKLKIAMENQKLLYEELEEKRQLDVERQKEIRKLQQENKTLTEKCEKLKENVRKEAETNVTLNNVIAIMEDEVAEKKKEIKNLKSLCTKNGIDYKKKGTK
jgi:translation initiation factor 2B subunit (eIF-2B alpha/beta/delta family)